jgi:hypothetical protein
MRIVIALNTTIWKKKLVQMSVIKRFISFLREQKIEIAKWTIFFSPLVYLYNSRSEPTEPVVKHLLSLVELFGVLPISVALIQNIATSLIWSERLLIRELVADFLKGCVAYVLAVWVIRSSGDEIYRWVIANPNGTVMGAATLAIVWMIAQFSTGSGYRQRHTTGSSRASMGLETQCATKPSKRDYQYIAAHEAGHALVYAALGNLPSGVKVAVNQRPDSNGILGFVTGIESQYYLAEKVFAEWYMLSVLAGKRGEMALFGETTLGSGNDHVRWLNVAKLYLVNHYKGVYYADPQNKFEAEINTEKLEALQAEQMALLDVLFNLNAGVFKELTDALLEKRVLSCEQLSLFLSRVRLPDGFPLPFGPFT